MFRQRLKDKADETGSVVLSAHECYTSKTCSHCGRLSTVGSSEVFKCSSCGLVSDRDLNAKNILMANTYTWELPPAILKVIEELSLPELTLTLDDLNVIES